VTDEGEGYYSVSGVTLQGDHVRWDSTGTASAKARSDVLLAQAAETIEANIDATISGISSALLSLTNGVETGVTVKQALRAVLAFVSGKADGGNTTPQHYRDPGDTVDRITFTVDANGNRSAVTLNL